MKLVALFTLLALGAGSANAAAIAKAEAGWCMLPGQPCWKARRAAEAETAVSKREAEAEARWCLLPGQPCWKVKRAAEAFADVVNAGGSAVARRSAEASSAGGLAAAQAKRALSSLAGIVSATQSNPRSFYSGLTYPFWVPDEPDTKEDKKKKREAAPEAEAAAEAAPEAEAEAGWCMLPGQPCWKARRAAEALVSTIQGSGMSKREAEANAAPWCLLPGQPCWKRDASPDLEARCHEPGGACASARRDLHAMFHAARSALDLVPEA